MSKQEIENASQELATQLQALPQDRNVLLEMAKKAGPPIKQKVRNADGTISEITVYSLRPLLKQSQ